MIGESMSIPVSVVCAAHDEKSREKILEEAKQIATSYTGKVSYLSIDEQAARAILDTAEAMTNPLICLGAFGDAPIREMFLGSVAEEILRRSNAPVLLLK
jgi:nucleotide-binding universal stress UspA family protein